MQQIERKCARSPKRKTIEANRSTRGLMILCALSMIIGVASGLVPVAAQETSSPLVRAMMSLVLPQGLRRRLPR